MSTLTEIFTQQALMRPDAVAITDQAGQVTYSELREESVRLAQRLIRHAGSPLVGLLTDRSRHIVSGALGILLSGRAYLPLDERTPPERLRTIINDAGLSLVVTITGLTDRVQEFGVETICVDALSESEPAALPVISPDNLAYVIYTSGSTGRPKGVMVEHRHVVSLLHATDSVFAFSPGDVWTLFHSCAFDAAVWEVWGALSHGARIVVVPYWTSRSPDAFLALLAQERVTVLAQTPSAFQALLRADRLGGPGTALSLRYVFLGGEKLDFGVLQPWFAVRGDEAPRVFNMYGPTETTVYATYRRIARSDTDLPASYIGIPLPHVMVRVSGADGEPVAEGDVGELLIGGPSVSRGYLHQPELTGDRFRVGPAGTVYATGDLVRYSIGGDLEYLGRMDAQVQIRGFRVEPAEVEAKLRGHPEVADCAVIGHTDATGTTTLAAYVVPERLVTAPPADASHPNLASSLREYLIRVLPDYMVPTSFTPVPELPLNQNGKLDRAALPAPSIARSATRDYPFNEFERDLCTLWATSLGVLSVAPTDDVFLMGAHSITAAQVALGMRQMGYDVPLRTLLTHRTARSVAQHLASGVA